MPGIISATPRISIHASLAGGDLCGLQKASGACLFQSTPPSREATLVSADQEDGYLFQSTPPSREATLSLLSSAPDIFYFNPRLPRGRRPLGHVRLLFPSLISIHASLAGGDDKFGEFNSAAELFQSTPPSREATIWCLIFWPQRAISIHASLAGGDVQQWTTKKNK